VEVVMSEVTQEDRNTAAALVIAAPTVDHPDIILHKGSDDTEFVQTFTRHRIASTTALQAELAEARARVAVLEGALGALITETDGLNYACNQLDGPAIIAARQALAGKETP
jgi:hypothetical protein